MMILKVLAGVAVAITLTIFIFGRMSSTVRVEHVFNAPVEKVWQVWTDPEAMKNWWSPKDFTAPVIKSDFRVEGTFLYSMRSAKGEMFWNAGKYLEIVPNQKIVSSLSFSDENGRLIPGKDVPVPGSWPDAVLLTVEFKSIDPKTPQEKTQVLITQEGIPMLMKMMSKMGWQQQMAKFELLLK